jgi:electron transport complex, RnfABCDGE type, B subunit
MQSAIRQDLQTRRLSERIDALLPQTQCRQCGYPGCKPYAEAVATGAADINQCPPGGDDGVRQLAALLGREPKPVDRRYGIPKPRTLARIDEQRCIGCTLCIQACPVDAIIGAAKLMHSVLEAECTGCELCLPPCPVDCIALLPAADDADAGRVPTGVDPVTSPQARADLARARHEFRLFRQAREKTEKAARLAARTAHKHAEPASRSVVATADVASKQALIAAAVARAQAKKTARDKKVSSSALPVSPLKNAAE